MKSLLSLMSVLKISCVVLGVIFFPFRVVHAENYVKLSKVQMEEKSILLKVFIEANRGDYQKPGYGQTWCVFNGENNYFDNVGFRMSGYVSEKKKLDNGNFLYSIFLVPMWNSQSIYTLEKRAEYLQRSMHEKMTCHIYAVGMTSRPELIGEFVLPPREILLHRGEGSNKF